MVPLKEQTVIAMSRQRPYCPACQRPLTTCLCALARRVDTPWPVVILQDATERGQAKGTVPLLQACVPTLLVWHSLDFSQHAPLNALLGDPRYRCLLVYPGEEARTASHWRPQLEAEGRVPCFILLDGTWRKSLRLLHSHPALLTLPRITLQQLPPGGYHIRKSTRRGGLSTFEATAALLAEWSEDPARYAPLQQAFDAWIARELARLPEAVRERQLKNIE